MHVSVACQLRNSLFLIPRRKFDWMSNSKALPMFIRNSSEDKSIPKNTIAHIYSASSQPDNGKMYDAKPFKIRLIPNKAYHWCLCGLSKSQPMCDGSHNKPHLKCTLKPIKFQVEDEDDYYLCNCKQTKLRPFCDGTHKTL